MEPQYPPPYPPPYRAAKKGIPAWVWVLIGCGCGVPLLLVPILAAILFPVFFQAREKAREQTCQSNVKQVALGVMMYTQDYDERLPLARSWMDTIQPYVRNDTLLRCPALANSAAGYGYAYSSKLNALKLMELPSPPTEPMIYDSVDLSRNASDAVASLPSPPRHLHNTMGYADGHVKALGQGQSSGSY